MLRCLLKMYEKQIDVSSLEEFTVPDPVHLGYQGPVLLCFSRRF